MMLPGRNNVTFRILSMLMLLSFALLGIPRVSAQGGGARLGAAPPAGIDAIRLPEPVTAPNKISRDIAVASGRTSVVVRLSKSPAALMTNQQAQGVAVAAEQDAIIARIRQLDPTVRVLGRTKILLNAVMLDIDATKLSDLATDVRVVMISPVVDFSLDLSETVPYIGATPAVQ
ncbi:hypothetical protein K2Z83_04965, partial [Oscillochloris sp. ZM17-4]|nr:hypothetical protein [Oscillochloris sp. ZM17-4]